MFHQLPTLTRKNILVFFFTLNDLLKDIAGFYALLSKDEQKKAQRFSFEKDSNQYTLARGALRVLLGHYLNVVPQSLTFSYHKYGKPYLEDFPEMQFNVSHSQEMVLLALNYEDLLGVDIEYEERSVDVDGIARRFFNDKEYARLRNLDAINKKRLFFYQWTAKEAFVKAIGRGIAFNLRDIEIASDAEEEIRIVNLHNSNENPADWIFYTLSLIPRYVAVLATKASSKVLGIKHLDRSLVQP